MDLKASRSHAVKTSEGTGVFGDRGTLSEGDSSGAGEEWSVPFWETLFPPEDIYTHCLSKHVSGLDCVFIQIEMKTSPFRGSIGGHTVTVPSGASLNQADNDGLQLSHC